MCGMPDGEEKDGNGMDGIIYLDNAATTKVSEGVLKEMLPYFCNSYGNPSSIYEFSVQSKKALVSARQEIAAFLNCEPNEIYFTSGGSESDNWALCGMVEAMAKKGRILSQQRLSTMQCLAPARRWKKKGAVSAMWAWMRMEL